MIRRFVLLFLFAAVLFRLSAQIPGAVPRLDSSGEDTPAQRYFLWVQQELDEGRWSEASAALERAADFSDELSDISFILAQVYAHDGKSRWTVLEAVEQAININKWKYYTEEQARYAAAQQLVALRCYAEALDQLAEMSDNADRAVLNLAALKELGVSSGRDDSFVSETPALKRAEFRQLMLRTIDRYPRDPRPLRIFFDYASRRFPAEDESIMKPRAGISEGDYYLLELALRQLPLLVEIDPELAWMALPFIHNREDARRLLASYRAGSLAPVFPEAFRPHPASIVCALDLSLISEEQAVEELFETSALDRDLIAAVGERITGEEGLNLFLHSLDSFSGVINADNDRDGIPENRIFYQDGVLQEYYYDEDQDGLTDLYVFFDNGIPQWANLSPASGVRKPGAGFSANPAASAGGPGEGGDIAQALVHWEKYPNVLRVEAEGSVYISRPLEFHFAPVDFTGLFGSEIRTGLLFPRSSGLWLSRWTLASHALQIQRPSSEFEGAVEWIDLDQGVPWRATEILNGRPVSITEYENGRPVLQRVDLDGDSRMETVRRFRKMEYSSGAPLDYQKIVEFSESDWNNDGLFETAEEYLLDGSVVYSWDMDGSGIRNYSETRPGNNAYDTEQK